MGQLKSPQFYLVATLTGITALTVGFAIYNQIPWHLSYLLTVNLIAMTLFGFDKSIAATQTTRVPESFFYLLALAGATPGIFLGMKIFRHKTRKIWFQIPLLVILLLQLALIAYLGYLPQLIGYRSNAYAEELKLEAQLKDKDDSYWKEKLTPEQFHVCREGGTERPFTGKYVDFHESGTFNCAACAAPLFSAETKFDSGTGWPSFYDALNPEAIEKRTDTSHGMVRTEVLCKKCGAHLGHLFPDGPKPTGQRYCINSVALDHTKGPENK